MKSIKLFKQDQDER